MPEILSLFADAYQRGQFAGRAIHWAILLFAGAVLVRRLIRGSFGPRFHRSTAVSAVAVAFVAAGMIVSAAYDLGGLDRDPARAAIVADCTSQGETAGVCGCYADEWLAHADDPAALNPLSQQIADVRAAGTARPASVTACIEASGAPSS